MALIDTQAVAVALDVPASTVRTWAARGWLTRVGEDHKRRALYDTAQVEHLAELRRRHARVTELDTPRHV